MELEFEWDENKNKANIIKHKIDFDTASHVFDDEFRILIYDEDNSEYEDRYIVLGEADGKFNLLSVSFTDRGNAIRIISARKATRSERRLYYDR